MSAWSIYADNYQRRQEGDMTLSVKPYDGGFRWVIARGGAVIAGGWASRSFRALEDADAAAEKEAHPICQYEIGGAVSCWVCHGSFWCKILECGAGFVVVGNRYAENGHTFMETIPRDEISGVMSASEVDAARVAGRFEYEDDICFGFFMEEATHAAH